jgi:hypothetical protein
VKLNQHAISPEKAAEMLLFLLPANYKISYRGYCNPRV